MAGMSPFKFPRYFGRMIIGGVYVPGVIESIDGASKPERWVYQMGLSVSNSVSIWRGTKLAESIKVVSRIYDDPTYFAAELFRDTMRPRLGHKPPSHMVLNGILNFVGITRVALKDIQLQFASGNSYRLLTEIGEYNPMKAVPVGPADPPKKETENDRLQQQFSALMDKAAKL